jgi:hypothetical protein
MQKSIETKHTISMAVVAWYHKENQLSKSRYQTWQLKDVPLHVFFQVDGSWSKTGIKAMGSGENTTEEF